MSLAPALLALRSGDLAAYHGVEHKAIAGYEEGADAADADKEHDRCGSHLVAPMLAAAAVGNVAMRRAGLRGPAAEAAVGLGSAAVAVEVFAWGERHPDSAVTRLMRRPGFEIQRAVGTREPTEEQLEVGRAALAEILRVEGGEVARRTRSAPRPRGLPAARRADPRGLLLGRLLQLHARAAGRPGPQPVVTVQVFQKQHSVLGGIDEAIAVLKLCSDDWSGLEVQALHEGDEIEPWEPVLQIDGDYALFAHLETVYLGVLSRRTRIMRNVRAGRRGRERQADPVLPGAPRPLAGADGRRLGGARGRRDRRLDRRAGVLVGRPRRRAPSRTA